MSAVRKAELEELWKRVGLSELRGSVQKAEGLIRDFEEALRALPPCDECARARLLEQIRGTGGRLSGEVVSLSVLAESLKTAMETAEQARQALEGAPPEPCRCPSGGCACHG